MLLRDIRYNSSMNRGNPEKRELPATERGLGAELRSARELREVSLREISETTKISMRFLEAIESDDLDTLPAPVFTRGFLIEYARYIGLDPEDIASRYVSLVQEEKSREEEEEARIRNRVGAGNLGAFEIWLLLILVLAIVATIVVYWVRSSPSQTGVSAGEVEVPSAVIDESRALPSEVDTDSDQPLSAELPMSMNIRATSDAWIVLWADGAKVMEDTLRAGDDLVFEASENFRFETLGNAGGVVISIDGQMIPPLGRAGEVVQNRSFERPAAEVLE